MASLSFLDFFCVIINQMANLVENKKARLNYEILEEYEAGIELLGGEVKALKSGQGSLDGARVAIRAGEAFLLGFHIPPYQPNNVIGSYEPERTRRLLLSQKEIKNLAEMIEQKRLTIIPISVYNKKRWLKVKIALVRGKKKFDKREDIKRRDVERDIGRHLKG